MRKLPIYLLVDTSESMRGEPIESVKNGIRMLVATLCKDPQCLELAHLSLITFGGEVKQVVPLTELCAFEIPKIHAEGERLLGGALSMLCECRKREVKVSTPEFKGDWRPYVFIITDGNPEDDITDGLALFQSMLWAAKVSCLAGPNADKELLNRITPDCVVDLATADPSTLSSFFYWDDDSIVSESNCICGDLPPPPPEVIIGDYKISAPKEDDVLSAKGESGQEYKYVWTATPMSGAMKDVYCAPDKSYCLAFFKEAIDAKDIERIRFLVEAGRQHIFGCDNGYWEQLFCWPKDIVRDGDKLGLVIPAFPEKFFFKHDGPTLSLKGMEKESKWHISPEFRYKCLPADEIGDWRSYFNVCLHLSRGMRKLSEMGFAFTDLSYRNVLVDPVSSSVHFITIDDNLIVPGKDSPNFIGTPDFIAPEVYENMLLPKNDPNRKLPCQNTDRHALAVLIYMFILCRHPLRGRQICDIDDPQKDEQLSMGAKAVFVEDPINRVNRYDEKWVQCCHPKSRWPYLLPWMDLDKLPYTILGPFLKTLLDRAFVQGLHNPAARPSAFEWEGAILQTMDLMIPCQNPDCKQKWFVFDNSASKPKCPFCGASYDIPLPVLNLYNGNGTSYKPTGMRVMVHNGTRLYQWHSDTRVVHNEKLTDEQKKPIAGFQFDQGKWYLRNERASGMMDMLSKKLIPVGDIVELKEGVQIRLDDENSRMIYVQMVNK